MVEEVECFAVVNPAAIDDDLVGVVNVQRAVVTLRYEDLGMQREVTADEVDVDAVEHRRPASDGQCSLFDDFAAEGFENLFARVDNTTGCAPVEGTIAAPVLHEHDLTVVDDDARGDGVSLHPPSIANVVRLRSTTCETTCEHLPNGGVPLGLSLYADVVSSGPEQTVVPSALPSGRARALAVIAVLISGACGALIGYAFAGLQCSGECTTWQGIGMVIGALLAAGGVAVVAVLTLRAMDEWQDTAKRQRDSLDRT